MDKIKQEQIDTIKKVARTQLIIYRKLNFSKIAKYVGVSRNTVKKYCLEETSICRFYNNKIYIYLLVISYHTLLMYYHIIPSYFLFGYNP
jgi:hypothetical protein